jgi:hypothetical protein
LYWLQSTISAENGHVLHKRCLWTCLLAMCLLGGAAVSARKWTWAMPRLDDRDASLRTIARQNLEIEDGPEQLRALLAKTPAGCDMLVVGPANDWRLTEVHGLISYLAWPRAVWLAPIGNRGHFPIEAKSPPAGAQPKFAFFFEISPPADIGEKGISIGPKLHAVALP